MVKKTFFGIIAIKGTGIFTDKIFMTTAINYYLICIGYEKTLLVTVSGGHHQNTASPITYAARRLRPESRSINS